LGHLLTTSGVPAQVFWEGNVGTNDWFQGFTQHQTTSTLAPAGQEDVADTLGFSQARGDSGGDVDGGLPPVAAVVGEGVDLASVLNNQRLGVGTSTQSTPLGEEGNFALAGQRTSCDEPFGKISDLRPGGRIHIETREGWSSYPFRNLDYVWAPEVDVVNPVPEQDVAEVTDCLLTLTSCHLALSDGERVIAYAVFDAWSPREVGPPPEMSHIVGVP
jgi:sortase A